MELFPFIFGCQICYRYKSKHVCQNLVAMAISMLTHTSLRLWNVRRVQPFGFWGGRGRYGWFELGNISFFPNPLVICILFFPLTYNVIVCQVFPCKIFFFWNQSAGYFFWYWITPPPPSKVPPSHKPNGWLQFQSFFFSSFKKEMSLDLLVIA